MRRFLWIVTFALYALLMVAVVGMLFYARRQMIATYDSPQEQAHWDEFRRDMRQRHLQSEEQRQRLGRESGQPVEAKPPKSRSARPPALELLQNHFAACLLVSVLAATMLFAVVWGIALGAVLRPGRGVGDAGEDAITTNDNEERSASSSTKA